MPSGIPIGVTLSVAKGLSRSAGRCFARVYTERSECAQYDNAVVLPAATPWCHPERSEGSLSSGAGDASLEFTLSGANVLSMTGRRSAGPCK